MGLVEDLKSRGWFLSAEGIEECTEGLENPKAEDVIRKAVNYDLVDIGEGGLSEDVTRNKVETMTGPVVVQIQKVRNVSAPKSNPEADHSQCLLRLHLTDGTSYCSAIQWGKWSNISLSTPPGSKILLKNEPIPVVNGFLLLAERDFKFLGGNVSHLIEKWELAKNLSHHKRIVGEEGAAPPWVPFGHKIDAGGLKNMKGNFKSMDLCQKDTKPNESFEKHRQLTIAEISRSKEGKVKVFGGGKQQPQDGDIAQLVSIGYSVEAAVSALKMHNCDIGAALQALEISDRFGANRRDRANRPETGRKKREPRERDSQDEKSAGRPSGPSTLFDYLQNQISLPKVPDVEDAHLCDFASSESGQFTNDASDRNSRGFRGHSNGGGHTAGRYGQHQRFRGSQDGRRGGDGDPPFQNHQDGPSSGFHGGSAAASFGRQRGRQQDTHNWNSSPSPSWTNHQAYGGRPAARDPPLAPPTSRDPPLAPPQGDGGDRRRPTAASAETVQNARPPPPRERNFQEATTRPAQQRRVASGQKVLAKYWEDGKFYRAVVHEVSSNGNTCVVKFVDYGNHEEVLCSDVQTVAPGQWDKGQMSSSRTDHHRHQGGHQQTQGQFSSNKDSEDYRYLEAMMLGQSSGATHQPPPQHQHQQAYHHHQQQQQHHQRSAENYDHGYRGRPAQHHKQQPGFGNGRPQQQYYQPPAQRRPGPS
uniref:Putative tudor domain protein n=1 Tax=Ixodes ricinus TaxID=34613 RepID=V5IHC2_IXORI